MKKLDCVSWTSPRSELYMSSERRGAQLTQNPTGYAGAQYTWEIFLVRGLLDPNLLLVLYAVLIVSCTVVRLVHLILCMGRPFLGAKNQKALAKQAKSRRVSYGSTEVC